MTVMATSLEAGAPLEEVFYRAERAERLAWWLEHHELPAGRVVQAFLTAQVRGLDIVCRTCPSCRKYLVALDPAPVL